MFIVEMSSELLTCLTTQWVLINVCCQEKCEHMFEPCSLTERWFSFFVSVLWLYWMKLVKSRLLSFHFFGVSSASLYFPCHYTAFQPAIWAVRRHARTHTHCSVNGATVCFTFHKLDPKASSLTFCVFLWNKSQLWGKYFWFISNETLSANILNVHWTALQLASIMRAITITVICRRFHFKFTFKRQHHVCYQPSDFSWKASHELLHCESICIF